MTEPKIDHERARKDVAHVLAAREDVSNAWLHNLSRAYLDLAERHGRLVEACQSELFIECESCGGFGKHTVDDGPDQSCRECSGAGRTPIADLEAVYAALAAEGEE